MLNLQFAEECPGAGEELDSQATILEGFALVGLM